MCVFALTCLLQKHVYTLAALDQITTPLYLSYLGKLLRSPSLKGHNFPKNPFNNCCHPWSLSQKLPKRISLILSRARTSDRRWGHQIMEKIMALKTSHIQWPGKYESFLWIITPIPSQREQCSQYYSCVPDSMYGIYSTLIYKNPYLELEIKSLLQ